MKKIFLISDSYTPDKTAAAKLMDDLAAELSKSYLIYVITASNKNFFIKNKNINILATKVPFIRSKLKLLKLIGELFMPFIIYYNYNKKFQFTLKPNLIICYSPSIFFGYLIKKLYLSNVQVKKILILRDIFPDWLVAAKILNKKTLTYFLLKLIQKRFFKIFNLIAVQSTSDIKFINKEFKKKCIVINNWTSIENISIRKNNYKKKIIFGGNIGMAQDIDFLKEMINFVKFSNKYTLTIIGSGRNESSLKNILKNNNLKNIKILKKISQKNYNKILESYDIGIISLKKNIHFNNLPGKFLSYIKKNLSILAFCSKKIDLFKLINENQLGIAIDKYNQKIIEKSLNRLSDEKIFSKKNLQKRVINLIYQKFNVEKVSATLQNYIK